MKARIKTNNSGLEAIAGISLFMVLWSGAAAIGAESIGTFTTYCFAASGVSSVLIGSFFYSERRYRSVARKMLEARIRLKNNDSIDLSALNKHGYAGLWIQLCGFLASLISKDYWISAVGLVVAFFCYAIGSQQSEDVVDLGEADDDFLS
jgi:hypothetical protein